MAKYEKGNSCLKNYIWHSLGQDDQLAQMVIDSIAPQLFELDEEVLIPIVDSMIEFSNAVSERARSEFSRLRGDHAD